MKMTPLPVDSVNYTLRPVIFDCFVCALFIFCAPRVSLEIRNLRTRGNCRGMHVLYIGGCIMWISVYLHVHIHRHWIFGLTPIG